MRATGIFQRWGQAIADPAAGFLLRATLSVVVLLAALRLDWVQQWLLIPYAALQGRLAAALSGGERIGVVVDQSCTGSDAMALCLGAILAFPASWRRRLVGAATGLAILTVVNTVRIGSLSAVVGDRELFELLHLRVWPAAIVLVAAGYVFCWFRWASARDGAPRAARPEAAPRAAPARRFLVLAVVLVGAYYAALDWLLASPLLVAPARWAAAAAGVLMSALGVAATVADGLLRTPNGAWVVTAECVGTPLIPVYLAAVLAAPLGRWPRALALAAAPPLFLGLATARLMVLALPRVLVGSHDVAVHAFYQVLLGLLAVAWLARRSAAARAGGTAGGWRAPAAAAGAGLLAGVAVGALDLALVRPLAGPATAALHLGHGYVDPQGVLALLPAYQLGLLAALWVAAGVSWRRGLVPAAALLVAGQAAALVALGEAAAHGSIELPTVLLRAGSLAAPLALAWGLGWLGRSGRAAPDPAPAAG